MKRGKCFVAVRPFSSRNFKCPGERRGTAEQFDVEPVAPPSDALGEWDGGRRGVKQRTHIETLTTRYHPGGDGPEEHTTPDSETALPDEEHVAPASAKRLPIGDHVIGTRPDDATGHGKRGDPANGVVASAHCQPAAIHQPYSGDDADGDTKSIGIECEGTEFELSTSRTRDEGTERAPRKRHLNKLAPRSADPFREGSPYDDRMESDILDETAEWGTLLGALRRVVGASNVITDDDQLASYRVDWTRRFVGAPAAVVRPGSTDEAALAMKLIVSAGRAVIPQGGNTGLVGGSMADPGAIVVSTTRLTDIGDIDVAAMQVSVGAGVTLRAVQERAAAVGLLFPVDLGGRDTATIGGMVATNAGGMAVLRFGMMRSQVVGIEAVLADGSVLRRMTGLLKDNTGFDFASMLVGSEGTLGLITAVRLRLVPGRETLVTLAISVPTFAAGLSVVRSLQHSGLTIDAAEVIRRQGVELMATHLNRGIPPEFGAQNVLFVNVVTGSSLHRESRASDAGGLSDLDLGALNDVLASLDDTPDALVATTDRERRSLWDWRERQAEALSARGIPVKLDVSLPVHELDGFEQSIDALVRNVVPRADVHVFGHIADGNLHVNVLGATNPAEERAIEHAVLGDVLKRGGSVSAEHGIGRAKRKWLRQQRGDADVDAMLAIKRAFDPRNLLNPGVLFDE